GGFTAILGHNGSGKSTLAKHFNAINLPVGGKVYIEKMDTADERLLYQIRQTVGMVFQNPDNQIVATIVEEDVAFAPENMGIESAEIRRRVDDALETVGMSKYKKRAPHMLSGGQKQRIAIAGVLAMEPAYIVLDEPTAMLDPIGRREVMATLKRLNREKNVTVVIITHNMDEAVLADRVVVMDKGKIVLDDIPKNVFSDVEGIKNIGLDVPQVTEFAYELRQRGFDIDKHILTVEEGLEALKPFSKSGTVVFDETLKAERNKPLIELKNVSYEYSPNGPYSKTALSNINLTINKGDFIAVIGHTGSGKSTLLQMMNALVKPTDGKVFVNGKSTSDKGTNLREIRTTVGLVFQYPEHQLFEETVRLDIAFSPKNMGLSDEEIDKRVKLACEIAGVHDSWLERSPFELSGGQKRRVAIAGVLAMQPQVLVLDEPTAGLDPGGKKRLLDRIRRMHDEYGITIVLVSHDMEDVAQCAERVVVLNDGEIFAEGTPLSVFSDYENLEKIGVTAPQITHLMDKLLGVKVCTVSNAVECFVKLNGGADNA
ncbi:MAG: energy-coupling factor transporter ATPase, partial [Clostridia bacterium]|nr:energy-coupling factor transporter ATPase [Clostridia bacterium]